MFDQVTLTGGEATVVWGYHTAAVCRSWTVTKAGRVGAWALSAVVSRVDAFKLTRGGSELKFTAPRQGGYFCWPVLTITLVDASHVSATLGPPEH
jgi:hypothetical protein